MQPTKVKYHIPKMTLEAHVNQIQLLKEVGMTSAFEENDIADGLTLTNLEQVVEIELNEEGIGGCPVEEAFKSPSVENCTDLEAIEFIVDKPYVFFIYHKVTEDWNMTKF